MSGFNSNWALSIRVQSTQLSQLADAASRLDTVGKSLAKVRPEIEKTINMVSQLGAKGAMGRMGVEVAALQTQVHDAHRLISETQSKVNELTRRMIRIESGNAAIAGGLGGGTRPAAGASFAAFDAGSVSKPIVDAIDKQAKTIGDAIRDALASQYEQAKKEAQAEMAKGKIAVPLTAAGVGVTTATRTVQPGSPATPLPPPSAGTFAALERIWTRTAAKQSDSRTFGAQLYGETSAQRQAARGVLTENFNISPSKVGPLVAAVRKPSTGAGAIQSVMGKSISGLEVGGLDMSVVQQEVAKYIHEMKVPGVEGKRGRPLTPENKLMLAGTVKESFKGGYTSYGAQKLQHIVRSTPNWDEMSSSERSEWAGKRLAQETVGLNDKHLSTGQNRYKTLGQHIVEGVAGYGVQPGGGNAKKAAAQVLNAAQDVEQATEKGVRVKSRLDAHKFMSDTDIFKLFPHQLQSSFSVKQATSEKDLSRGQEGLGSTESRGIRTHAASRHSQPAFSQLVANDVAEYVRNNPQLLVESKSARGLDDGVNPQRIGKDPLLQTYGVMADKRLQAMSKEAYETDIANAHKDYKQQLLNRPKGIGKADWEEEALDQLHKTIGVTDPKTKKMVTLGSAQAEKSRRDKEIESKVWTERPKLDEAGRIITPGTMTTAAAEMASSNAQALRQQPDLDVKGRAHGGVASRLLKTADASLGVLMRIELALTGKMGTGQSAGKGSTPEGGSPPAKREKLTKAKTPDGIMDGGSPAVPQTPAGHWASAYDEQEGRLTPLIRPGVKTTLRIGDKEFPGLDRKSIQAQLKQIQDEYVLANPGMGKSSAAAQWRENILPKAEVLLTPSMLPGQGGLANRASRSLRNQVASLPIPDNDGTGQPPLDPQELGYVRKNVSYRTPGKRLREATGRAMYYGLGATALYGGAATAKQSIQFMSQYEEQMVRVQRVMNPLGANMAELSAKAQGLGRSLGVGVKDMVQGMEIFAQQGLSQAEILERTKVSALATNVTYLTLTESTEALTAASKQFKIPGQEFMKILDAWNEVENTTAVNTQVLTKAIMVAGTTARIAGFSFHETNGIIAAVGEATRKSGQAIGTSMKFIFQHLRQDDAIKALQDVGIYSRSAEGALLSTKNVLASLRNRWDGLTEAQRQNVSLNVAGTRHANDFFVMMERWDRQMDVSVTSMTSQGSAMRENEKTMQSLSKQTSQLGAEWQSFLVTIADNGAISTLKEMTSWLTKIVGLLRVGNEGTGMSGMLGAAAVGIAGAGAFAMPMLYNGADLMRDDSIREQVHAVKSPEDRIIDRETRMRRARLGRRMKAMVGGGILMGTGMAVQQMSQYEDEAGESRVSTGGRLAGTVMQNAALPLMAYRRGGGLGGNKMSLFLAALAAMSTAGEISSIKKEKAYESSPDRQVDRQVAVKEKIDALFSEIRDAISEIDRGGTVTADVMLDLTNRLRAVSPEFNNVANSVGDMTEALRRGGPALDQIRKEINSGGVDAYLSQLRSPEHQQSRADLLAKREKLNEELASGRGSLDKRLTIPGKQAEIQASLSAMGAGRESIAMSYGMSGRGLRGLVNSGIAEEDATDKMISVEDATKNMVSKYIYGLTRLDVPFDKVAPGQSTADVVNKGYLQTERDGKLLRLSDNEEVASGVMAIDGATKALEAAGALILRPYEQVEGSPIVGKEAIEQLATNLIQATNALGRRNDEISQNVDWEARARSFGQGSAGTGGTTNSSIEEILRVQQAQLRIEQKGIQRIEFPDGGEGDAPGRLARRFKSAGGQLTRASSNPEGVSLGALIDLQRETQSLFSGAQAEGARVIDARIRNSSGNASFKDLDEDEGGTGLVGSTIADLVKTYAGEKAVDIEYLITQIEAARGSGDTATVDAKSEEVRALFADALAANFNNASSQIGDAIKNRLDQLGRPAEDGISAMGQRYAYMRNTGRVGSVGEFMGQDDQRKWVDDLVKTRDDVASQLEKAKENLSEATDPVVYAKAEQVVSNLTVKLNAFDASLANLPARIEGVEFALQQMNDSIQSERTLGPQAAAAQGLSGMNAQSEALKRLEAMLARIESDPTLDKSVTAPAIAQMVDAIRGLRQSMSDEKRRRSDLSAGAVQAAAIENVVQRLGLPGGGGAGEYVNSAQQQIAEQIQMAIGNGMRELEGRPDDIKSFMSQATEKFATALGPLQKSLLTRDMDYQKAYLTSTPSQQLLADQIEQMIQAGRPAEEIFAFGPLRDAAKENPLFGILAERALKADRDDPVRMMQLTETMTSVMSVGIPQVNTNLELILAEMRGRGGSPDGNEAPGAPRFASGTLSKAGSAAVDHQGRIRNDGTPAVLHAGEIVLNKKQSEAMLKNQFASGTLPSGHDFEQMSARDKKYLINDAFDYLEANANLSATHPEIIKEGRKALALTGMVARPEVIASMQRGNTSIGGDLIVQDRPRIDVFRSLYPNQTRDQNVIDFAGVMAEESDHIAHNSLKIKLGATLGVDGAARSHAYANNNLLEWTRIGARQDPEIGRGFQWVAKYYPDLMSNVSSQKFYDNVSQYKEIQKNRDLLLSERYAWGPAMASEVMGKVGINAHQTGTPVSDSYRRFKGTFDETSLDYYQRLRRGMPRHELPPVMENVWNKLFRGLDQYRGDTKAYDMRPPGRELDGWDRGWDNIIDQSRIPSKSFTSIMEDKNFREWLASIGVDVDSKYSIDGGLEGEVALFGEPGKGRAVKVMSNPGFTDEMLTSLIIRKDQDPFLPKNYGLAKLNNGSRFPAYASVKEYLSPLNQWQELAAAGINSHVQQSLLGVSDRERQYRRGDYYASADPSHVIKASHQEATRLWSLRYGWSAGGPAQLDPDIANKMERFAANQWEGLKGVHGRHGIVLRDLHVGNLMVRPGEANQLQPVMADLGASLSDKQFNNLPDLATRSDLANIRLSPQGGWDNIIDQSRIPSKSFTSIMKDKSFNEWLAAAGVDVGSDHRYARGAEGEVALFGEPGKGRAVKIFGDTQYLDEMHIGMATRGSNPSTSPFLPKNYGLSRILNTHGNLAGFASVKEHLAGLEPWQVMATEGMDAHLYDQGHSKLPRYWQNTSMDWFRKESLKKIQKLYAGKPDVIAQTMAAHGQDIYGFIDSAYLGLKGAQDKYNISFQDLNAGNIMVRPGHENRLQPVMADLGYSLLDGQGGDDIFKLERTKGLQEVRLAQSSSGHDPVLTKGGWDNIRDPADILNTAAKQADLEKLVLGGKTSLSARASEFGLLPGQVESAAKNTKVTYKAIDPDRPSLGRASPPHLRLKDGKLRGRASRPYIYNARGNTPAEMINSVTGTLAEEITHGPDMRLAADYSPYLSGQGKQLVSGSRAAMENSVLQFLMKHQDPLVKGAVVRTVSSYPGVVKAIEEGRSYNGSSPQTVLTSEIYGRIFEDVAAGNGQMPEDVLHLRRTMNRVGLDLGTSLDAGMNADLLTGVLDDDLLTNKLVSGYNEIANTVIHQGPVEVDGPAGVMNAPDGPYKSPKAGSTAFENARRTLYDRRVAKYRGENRNRFSGTSRIYDVGPNLEMHPPFSDWPRAPTMSQVQSWPDRHVRNRGWPMYLSMEQPVRLDRTHSDPYDVKDPNKYSYDILEQESRLARKNRYALTPAELAEGQGRAIADPIANVRQAEREAIRAQQQRLRRSNRGLDLPVDLADELRMGVDEASLTFEERAAMDARRMEDGSRSLPEPHLDLESRLRAEVFARERAKHIHGLVPDDAAVELRELRLDRAKKLRHQWQNPGKTWMKNKALGFGRGVAGIAAGTYGEASNFARVGKDAYLKIPGSRGILPFAVLMSLDPLFREHGADNTFLDNGLHPAMRALGYAGTASTMAAGQGPLGIGFESFLMKAGDKLQESTSLLKPGATSPLGQGLSKTGRGLQSVFGNRAGRAIGRGMGKLSPAMLAAAAVNLGLEGANSLSGNYLGTDKNNSLIEASRATMSALTLPAAPIDMGFEALIGEVGNLFAGDKRRWVGEATLDVGKRRHQEGVSAAETVRGYWGPNEDAGTEDSRYNRIMGEVDASWAYLRAAGTGSTSQASKEYMAAMEASWQQKQSFGFERAWNTPLAMMPPATKDGEEEYRRVFGGGEQGDGPAAAPRDATEYLQSLLHDTELRAKALSSAHEQRSKSLSDVIGGSKGDPLLDRLALQVSQAQARASEIKKAMARTHGMADERGNKKKTLATMSADRFAMLESVAQNHPEDFFRLRSQRAAELASSLSNMGLDGQAIDPEKAAQVSRSLHPSATGGDLLTQILGDVVNPLLKRGGAGHLMSDGDKVSLKTAIAKFNEGGDISGADYSIFDDASASGAASQSIEEMIKSQESLATIDSLKRGSYSIKDYKKNQELLEKWMSQLLEQWSGSAPSPRSWGEVVSGKVKASDAHAGGMGAVDKMAAAMAQAEANLQQIQEQRQQIADANQKAEDAFASTDPNMRAAYLSRKNLPLDASAAVAFGLPQIPADETLKSNADALRAFLDNARASVNNWSVTDQKTQEYDAVMQELTKNGKVKTALLPNTKELEEIYERWKKLEQPGYEGWKQSGATTIAVSADKKVNAAFEKALKEDAPWGAYSTVSARAVELVSAKLDYVLAKRLSLKGGGETIGGGGRSNPLMDGAQAPREMGPGMNATREERLEYGRRKWEEQQQEEMMRERFGAEYRMSGEFADLPMFATGTFAQAGSKAVDHRGRIRNDGTPAILHAGEVVLNRNQSEAMLSNQFASGTLPASGGYGSYRQVVEPIAAAAALFKASTDSLAEMVRSFIQEIGQVTVQHQHTGQVTLAADATLQGLLAAIQSIINQNTGTNQQGGQPVRGQIIPRRDQQQ